MKEYIDDLIKQLDLAQDLLYRGKNDDAVTAIYEAQCMAISMRDHNIKCM